MYPRIRTTVSVIVWKPVESQVISKGKDQTWFVGTAGNLGSYKTFQEKTDDIIESRDISHMRQEELKREKREADNKVSTKSSDVIMQEDAGVEWSRG